MKTSQFAIATLVTRIAWAAVTVGLTGLLSVSSYGEYAFLQITSSIGSQLAFGAFSNMIGAKIAGEPSAEEANALVPLSLVYGLMVSLVAFLSLLVLAAFGVPHLDISSAAITALWMWATFATAIAIGSYVARRLYARAVQVSVLQLALYGASLWLGGTQSGTLASLSAAVGQLLPCLVFLFLDHVKFSTWRQYALKLGTSLFRIYVQAMYMNVAYIPGLILLWLATAALASNVSDTTLAAYGLGNQLAALLLFLPSSISSVAISRFAREPRHDRKVRDASWTMAAFVVLGAIGAVGSFVAIPFFSQYLPSVFGGGRSEIALGIVMGGLIAARSPFAWLNQVESRSGSEALSALIGAAFIGAALIFSTNSGVDLLFARCLAALAILLFSYFIYKKP